MDAAGLAFDALEPPQGPGDRCAPGKVSTATGLSGAQAAAYSSGAASHMGLHAAQQNQYR